MVAELTEIDGSMYAGKTTEAQRLARRAEIAGKCVQFIKPDIDQRYDAEKVCSHDGNNWEATCVDIHHPEDILISLKPETNYVIIDEVQFFDPLIVQVVDTLLEADIEVVVAGLPLDFRGEPFGQMPVFMARAENKIHLTAICTYETDDGKRCGADATRTQRLVNGEPARFTDPIILVGAQEAYTARCTKHHEVPGKPTLKKTLSQDTFVTEELAAK